MGIGLAEEMAHALCTIARSAGKIQPSPVRKQGPITTGHCFTKDVSQPASLIDFAVWVAAFAGTTLRLWHGLASQLRPSADIIQWCVSSEARNARAMRCRSAVAPSPCATAT